MRHQEITPVIVRLRARHAKVYLEHVLLELGPATYRPLEVLDSRGGATILTLFPNKVRYGHPDDDPDDPSSWTPPGFSFRTAERYGQEFWTVEFE